MAGDVLRAHQGDTLDLLIWRDRGLGTAAYDAVLRANPGIADAGPVLAIDTRVTVPGQAAAAPAELPSIQLWD